MAIAELTMRVDPQRLLASSVDALAEEDLDSLGDEAIGEDMIAMRREIDRLEAEFARRLHRFQKLRGQERTHLPIVSWLRYNCRLTSRAAHERVQLARSLAELPQTDRQLRGGEIAYEHATAISRSVRDIGIDEVRRAEPTLLDAAAHLDPGRLCIVTRRLQYCVDPDGSLKDERRSVDLRWLELNQLYDGNVLINGSLDAEAGAKLRTALRALMHPASTDAHSKRLADALVELCDRVLLSGTLPSSKGDRPQLIVTTSPATLRGDPECGPGELRGSGSLHFETVRRLACDAVITFVELNADGDPEKASQKVRTIPAPVRTALDLRDQHCQYPGCDLPPEWCDAHHIIHRADGGSNRLKNLILLCRRHHTARHDEDYERRREHAPP
jgi:hypothetical protein